MNNSAIGLCLVFSYTSIKYYTNSLENGNTDQCGFLRQIAFGIFRQNAIDIWRRFVYARVGHPSLG